MTHVNVRLIDRPEQLSEDRVRRWNELARHPLQRWEWMGTWARKFVAHGRLRVLEFSSAGRVVGFAPWAVEHRLATGRTLQFLGSGKACTDHQSLLVDADWLEPVSDAAADWLLGRHRDLPQHGLTGEAWDSIEWIGVDRGDAAIHRLTERLRQAGCTVQVGDAENCYALSLPGSWEQYVAGRSKSGRREIRQALRQIDEGVLVVHPIATRRELDRYWPQLIRLHQSRRASLGTDGCFDYPQFASFLRSAAESMLDAGRLRFLFALSGEMPVAAHLAFADQRGWYYYQSGMDPDAAELRPGLALFCYTLREAIESGLRTFDLMRGDEPYKQRWKAQRVAAEEIRIFSNRWSGQMRHRVRQTGVALKDWLKSGLTHSPVGGS